MSEIYIVGVGMTHFGKLVDQSIKAMVATAVRQALEDAGARVPDIGAAFFANSTQAIMDGQHAVRGQMALRPLGFAGIPIVNVENACAGGSTALNQAVANLKAGTTDVALAVGVEKMVDPHDKRKSSAIFDGAWEVHEVDEVVGSLAQIGDGMPPPPGKELGVKSPFMELYASMTRGHMARFGTTERQIAAVAAKNHHHSTMNPLSQYQTDMTIDEVLAGTLISWPLTLPMCSPISDGAAAALICTKDALARFPNSRPVKVMASVLTSGSDREWSQFDMHLCRRAAAKAYEISVGPEDVSVAEVHDASSFAEIIQTENLGFCELGQGGWLAERGETSIGGRLPINPSGGLISKGHPISATGLGQIHELTLQLRGEAGARQVDGARIAVAENGGGFHGVEEAAAVVTVLGR
jgi:acetyl-CoA acetyltransferase